MTTPFEEDPLMIILAGEPATDSQEQELIDLVDQLMPQMTGSVLSQFGYKTETAFLLFNGVSEDSHPSEVTLELSAREVEEPLVTFGFSPDDYFSESALQINGTLTPPELGHQIRRAIASIREGLLDPTPEDATIFTYLENFSRYYADEAVDWNMFEADEDGKKVPNHIRELIAKKTSDVVFMREGQRQFDDGSSMTVHTYEHIGRDDEDYSYPRAVIMLADSSGMDREQIIIARDGSIEYLEIGEIDIDDEDDEMLTVDELLVLDALRDAIDNSSLRQPLAGHLITELRLWTQEISPEMPRDNI